MITIVTRHIVKIFAAVLIPVFHTLLFAQMAEFEPPPSSNQLLANSVFALLRDKEGFLWIGTQHGLHRYDGERFTIYTHREDDSSSLSDNFIISLAEDSSGNIWVGTRHGLNRYDKLRQTFRRFYLLDLSVTPFHQTITSLAADRTGLIFATIAGKLFTINADSGFQVQRIKNNDSTVHVSIDRDRHLVIASVGSIEVITPKGERLHGSIDPRAQISSVLKYGSRVYVASDRGVLIFLINGPNRSIDFSEMVSVPGRQVHHLCVDHRSRIWLATDDGIVIIGKDGRRVHVKADSKKHGGVFSSNVRAVISDASGLVWIGMLRHGIQKYDPLKENILTVDKQSFGNNGVVWSIAQDRSNHLWVGTQKGLFRFRPDDSLFRKPIPFAPSLFGDMMVGLLKEDRSGNMWIGTNENSLWRYNPSIGEIKRYDLFQYTAEKKIVTITDIYERHDGELWTATTNGLFLLDPAASRFRQVPVHHPNYPNENTYLMSVMEAADGTAWCSSSSRLYRYDPATRTHTTYLHQAGDSTSLSFPILSSTYQDSKGRLWVSTLGRGFNRFDPHTGRSERFHSGNGLVNDVVYGMLEDTLGRLWMSTDNGLASFDPETKQFFSVGTEEGLKFLEFSHLSQWKNQAGELFFGGIGGFVKLEPERIQPREHDGPIIVTDIRINYSSIPPIHASLTKGTLTSPQQIDLTSEQTTLSIDFTSLDFRAAGRVKYAYRLSGFYDGWVEPANSQRTAHYTHLPSGEYVLTVRSSIRQGVWNDDALRIRIIVHPPFWQTWWFMLIGISMFMGATVAVVRYISQRTLKEQLRETEVQKKIHAERERISRELHDSTGANLAGIISGLSVAEKYLSTSVRSSKKTIRSLTSDARDSMAQLRETIWAMKTNEMHVGQFAEAVEENVRTMLKYKKGITVRLHRTGTDRSILSSMQVLNLYRIVQESVNNALIHSRTTTIDVLIAAAETELTIVIENNGTRKKRRMEPWMHGFGTENMERRTAELHGTILIDVGEKQGCRVTVTVPLRGVK